MIQKGYQAFRHEVYQRLNVWCNGSDESKCNKVKNAESKGSCDQWWTYGPGNQWFTSDVSLSKDKAVKHELW